MKINFYIGMQKTLFKNYNNRILLKKKNKEINKKQQFLIEDITKEISKINPNIETINKYQQELNDIENYKITGTIIRSKEK